MPSKVRQQRHQRRFPIGPLLDVLPADIGAAAAALGMSTKTIRDWRTGTYRAELTERMADRYAVRLGRHPANIWIDW